MLAGFEKRSGLTEFDRRWQVELHPFDEALVGLRLLLLALHSDCVFELLMAARARREALRLKESRA